MFYFCWNTFLSPKLNLTVKYDFFVHFIAWTSVCRVFGRSNSSTTSHVSMILGVIDMRKEKKEKKNLYLKL